MEGVYSSIVFEYMGVPGPGNVIRGDGQQPSPRRRQVTAIIGRLDHSRHFAAVSKSCLLYPNRPTNFLGATTT
jgi:hypothetical protein